MTDNSKPTLDPNELINSYERWLALGATLVEPNKNCIFDALEQAGVTKVELYFDGEGDSGQIEEVRAYKDDEAVELPSIPVEFVELPFGAREPASHTLRLTEALETMAYALLSLKHDGWENNEGAWGDFTFDVATRTVSLDHHERVIESELHSHSW